MMFQMTRSIKYSLLSLLSLSIYPKLGGVLEISSVTQHGQLVCLVWLHVITPPLPEKGSVCLAVLCGQPLSSTPYRKWAMTPIIYYLLFRLFLVILFNKCIGTQALHELGFIVPIPGEG